MGKYMKKSKVAGDIAVLEVSPSSPSSSSSIGVRTRAKTLALQRLQKPVSPDPNDPSFRYLQLRSRRLEKPPLPAKQQQHKGKTCKHQNSNPMPTSKLPPRSPTDDNNDKDGSCCENEGTESAYEARAGENSLGLKHKDRSTRESTSCNLIKASDTIAIPGSTTRRTSMPTTNQEGKNNKAVNPPQHEVDAFFAAEEQKQARSFAEKYNFDIVNDVPLPGRYDWEELTP